VSFAHQDRVFADDIEKGLEIIRSGGLMDVLNTVSKKKQVSLKTAYESLFEIY
jgi:histidine ammonia-lyase